MIIFFKKNWIIIIESLIAIIVLILNISLVNYQYIKWIIFGFLVLDIIVKFIKTLKNAYEEEQLKKENIINNINLKKERIKFRKELEKQSIFNEKYKEKKEKSLKVFSRFFSRSLLNEKDILKLAKSTTYYLLYVYSWPFPRIKKYSFNTKRQYPVYLHKIGFIRLKKQGTFFIIKKDNLEKNLQNIIKFKYFLTRTFEKIRKEELELYLTEVKSQNNKLYNKYSKQDLNDYLKMNFLLVECILNYGNIGLVNGEYIGLTNKTENKDISKEIIGNLELCDLKLNTDNKLKIKNYFIEQDFDILLEGVDQKTINLISNNRQNIKNDLNINCILDLADKNTKDIRNILYKIKIKNYSDIARILKNNAKLYKNALVELNISLD